MVEAGTGTGADGDPSSITLAEHLSVLGIDPDGARIYLHLLEVDTWSIESLAETLRMDRCAVTAGLDSLVENGLIIQSEDGGDILHTVSPDLGLARLIDARSHQIRQAENALDDARRASATVVERACRTDVDAASLEIVDGRFGVTDHVGILLREASDEVLSMLTELPTPAALTHARASDATLLARGVRSRILTLDGHLRASTAFAQHMHFLAERGADVGVIATLPVRMIIIDRAAAVLPADLRETTSGAVVVRQPVIVSLLVQMFEQAWMASRPLTGRSQQPTDDWQPTALEREVMHLLAAGIKDEAVARRVGLSLRSVRRLISGVSAALGTESRFQLGVTCSERGWAGPGPSHSTGADLGNRSAAVPGPRGTS